ncbi:hypothetical protein RRG08_057818 [Elysia crispata]|uniref:Uncharacterized protein n=1 Tax=Elysia crispata TaxID=231223 RepID=A0AAE1AZ71_9GAST|nr:hypothetical protein RRG08_057818 [Elysia crispata]
MSVSQPRIKFLNVCVCCIANAVEKRQLQNMELTIIDRRQSATNTAPPILILDLAPVHKCPPLSTMMLAD